MGMRGSRRAAKREPALGSAGASPLPFRNKAWFLATAYDMIICTVIPEVRRLHSGGVAAYAADRHRYGGPAPAPLRRSSLLARLAGHVGEPTIKSTFEGKPPPPSVHGFPRGFPSRCPVPLPGRPKNPNPPNPGDSRAKSLQQAASTRVLGPRPLFTHTPLRPRIPIVVQSLAAHLQPRRSRHMAGRPRAAIGSAAALPPFPPCNIRPIPNSASRLPGKPRG